MNKTTIKDISLQDKQVIARVDFNVPLNKDIQITDDARIQAALPTIKYILENGAKKLILMSHLGRPKGAVVEGMRLGPVAARLSKLLSEEVVMLDDCVGEKVKETIAASSARVFLLENLRFYSQETKGDDAFAQQLSQLADVYVNDAFGTAHRAHASTTVIAKHLPSAAGFLMEKEIQFLSQALHPAKPYVVILGGAKVSDKIAVVENLITKADKILIGGAMAYTFLKAQGIDVGVSRTEEDKLSLASGILTKAKEKGVSILLPIDHVTVESLDAPLTKKIQGVITSGCMGVDVGPKTVTLFKEALSDAKTVLWNGPLGIFENAEYAQGTKEVAEYLATLKDATVIVGGGDSALAAKVFGVKEKLSHVSTGGGASLEYLEGKELPGIAAIMDKDKG